MVKLHPEPKHLLRECLVCIPALLLIHLPVNAYIEWQQVVTEEFEPLPPKCKVLMQLQVLWPDRCMHLGSEPQGERIEAIFGSAQLSLLCVWREGHYRAGVVLWSFSFSLSLCLSHPKSKYMNFWKENEINKWSRFERRQCVSSYCGLNHHTTFPLSKLNWKLHCLSGCIHPQQWNSTSNFFFQKSRKFVSKKFQGAE